MAKQLPPDPEHILIARQDFVNLIVTLAGPSARGLLNGQPTTPRTPKTPRWQENNPAYDPSRGAAQRAAAASRTTFTCHQCRPPKKFRNQSIYMQHRRKAHPDTMGAAMRRKAKANA